MKNEKVLQTIIEESDYAARLDVPPDQALAHLKEAVRVRFKNRTDTIEVGLVGKRKEDAELLHISEVLFKAAEVQVLEIAPSFEAYMKAVAEARERAASE